MMKIEKKIVSCFQNFNINLIRGINLGKKINEKINSPPKISFDQIRLWFLPLP